MRIASKPVLLTVPVVMFITLMAVLALWATGTIGGNGGPGASSNASIVWNVEYWHRNANGDLLQHVKDQNAVSVQGLESAMERLISDGSPNTDTFDQILLMKTDQTAAPATDAVNFTDDVLLLVDGAGADTTHENPADGTYNATGGGDNDTIDGAGTVQVTFTGMGSGAGPAAALQMRLVRSVPNDTLLATVVPSLVETLATLPISVDLAATDTLTVTWTIDINP